MPNLRLYREIYKIENSPSGEVYTLINPYFLSASTVNFLNNSIVENLNTIQESLGVYYVDLNSDLYSQYDIYQIIWTIKYTSNSASKYLKSKFKTSTTISTSNVVSDIEIHLENNSNIEYTIENDEIITIINNN